MAMSDTVQNLTYGYQYDELNRLARAETTNTNLWGNTCSYDIWGNLLTIGGIQPQYNSCTQESLGVGVTTKNQISGYGYDAAGNLTNNPGVATFSYDAENRMILTAGVTYKYDGDGKRVGKDTNSDGNLDKIYWHGMSSDPLLETDGAGNGSDEFVFFGGKRIARRNVATGNVFYYFADHLGTSRVIAQGGQNQPCYDADYYPFGGERVITDTCPQNYKFTGKERDSESGLDNFVARYNSSSLGRFMSPDPLGGRILAPQTLNKYSYVRNNPLNLIDPTGMYVVLPSKTRQVVSV